MQHRGCCAAASSMPLACSHGHHCQGLGRDALLIATKSLYMFVRWLQVIKVVGRDDADAEQAGMQGHPQRKPPAIQQVTEELAENAKGAYTVTAGTVGRKDYTAMEPASSSLPGDHRQPSGEASLAHTAQNTLHCAHWHELQQVSPMKESMKQGTCSN